MGTEITGGMTIPDRAWWLQVAREKRSRHISFLYFGLIIACPREDLRQLVGFAPSHCEEIEVIERDGQPVIQNN